MDVVSVIEDVIDVVLLGDWPPLSWPQPTSNTSALAALNATVAILAFVFINVLALVAGNDMRLTRAVDHPNCRREKSFRDSPIRLSDANPSPTSHQVTKMA